MDVAGIEFVEVEIDGEKEWVRKSEWKKSKKDVEALVREKRGANDSPMSVS